MASGGVKLLVAPRSPEVGFEYGESVVVLLDGRVSLAELFLEEREVIFRGQSLGLGSSFNHLPDHEIIAVGGSGDDDEEKESEDGERKLETIHLEFENEESREGKEID